MELSSPLTWQPKTDQTAPLIYLLFSNLFKAGSMGEKTFSTTAKQFSKSFPVSSFAKRFQEIFRDR